MATQFAVKYSTFKYKNTRNGIYLTAPIFDLKGNKIGTLFDDPSAIVARVEFDYPDEARKFVAESHTNLAADSWVHASKTVHPDTAWVSEYARQITKQAEDEYLTNAGVTA